MFSFVGFGDASIVRDAAKHVRRNLRSVTPEVGRVGGLAAMRVATPVGSWEYVILDGDWHWRTMPHPELPELSGDPARMFGASSTNARVTAFVAFQLAVASQMMLVPDSEFGLSGKGSPGIAEEYWGIATRYLSAVANGAKVTLGAARNDATHYLQTLSAPHSSTRRTKLTSDRVVDSRQSASAVSERVSVGRESSSNSPAQRRLEEARRLVRRARADQRIRIVVSSRLTNPDGATAGVAVDLSPSFDAKLLWNDEFDCWVGVISVVDFPGPILVAEYDDAHTPREAVASLFSSVLQFSLAVWESTVCEIADVKHDVGILDVCPDLAAGPAAVKFRDVIREVAVLLLNLADPTRDETLHADGDQARQIKGVLTTGRKELIDRALAI